MATTHFEGIFQLIGPNDVDNAGSVLFLVETLQHEVAGVGSLKPDQMEVDAFGFNG